MAYEAIYGNFITGEISENNVLPLTAGGNSVVLDINAQDRLTLNVSKRELNTPDWSSILSEASTLIALVDTDKAWNEPGAVLAGGMLNKISGAVKESIALQVVGLREYLAALIINPKLAGTYTNPNSGCVFSANSWQGIINAIVAYARDIEKTPDTFGAIDGVVQGETIQRPVLYSDGVIFAQLLDAIRDTESDSGNEYQFVLQWTGPEKTHMEWRTVIGSDANPQINYNNTLEIPLSTVSEFKSLSFSMSISTEKMANRVISQSKTGNPETGDGADISSTYVDNGKPLLDIWYSAPGELTPEQKDAQVAARLNDLKTTKGTAEYSVIGEPQEWIQHKGKKIIFTGEPGTDAEGYSATVRMTGLTFSPDNKNIRLDLMYPQARYPKLPSDTSKKKDSLTNSSETPLTGGFGSGVGTPPNVKPGAYVPPGGIVKDAPPVTGPVIDSNDYTKNKVATGQYHTLAINQGGKLYAWGRNFSGALGYMQDENYIALSPQQIGTDEDWDAVFASGKTSYALKNDGTLWSWGDNTYGQAGLGLDSSIPSIWTPTKTSVKDIRKIYFYTTTVWIIKTDGTLWYTGYPQISEGGLANATAFTRIGVKSDWVKLDYTPWADDATGYSLEVTRLDAAGVLWKANGTQITAPIGFKDFILNITISSGHPIPWFVAIGMDDKLYSWGTGYHDADGIQRTKTAPTISTAVDNVYGLLQIGNSQTKLPQCVFIVKKDGRLWRMGINYMDSTGPEEVSTLSGIDFMKSTYVRAVNNTNYGGGLWVISESGELWGLGRGNFGTGSADISYKFLNKLSEEKVWKRLNADTQRALAVLNEDMFVTGDNSYGHLGMGSRGQYYTSWTIQPSSQG